MAKLPAKIGKYKITSQIGEGGMGAVYKAEHPTLHRTVIIKKLTLTGSQDFVERFKREAQIMIDFRNENIVQVYDHFKEGSSYHIVMEYVDGITLEELIEQRRFLSEEAAILIFTEICKALKYAHDRLVIHRDIKPANILISKTGIVKLVDFGVSANLEGNDEGLTKAGMTIGTPSYLAPEQISNAKNRDKRTDIYSMGVMLYEMVIGKKPYRGGFTADVIALIEKGRYTLPRKINPKIKPFIQRVIKKAMHHKVRKRFQNLGIVIGKFSKHLKKYKDQNEINNTIRLYLEGKEITADKHKKHKGKSFLSKVLAFTTAASILLVVLGAGVLWSWKQGYHYEYLYAEEYGSLQIAVKIKKNHKSVDDFFISTTLFQENNGKLQKQQDVVFSFKEDKSAESRSYYTLTSNRVFLKRNMYKLLLYVENEQYRENFFLMPRILQRKKLDTLDGRKVLFTINKIPPKLPVRLSYSIYDIYTGDNITPTTNVSILRKGKWKDWSEINKTEEASDFFVSGNRYRFQFKKDGYYKKIYNVTIQPEQTILTMNLNLIPIPGKLLIKSNSEDIKYFLNNSTHYVSGGKNRSVKALKPLSSKYREIVLSPGEYVLSAKNKKFFFSSPPTSQRITIQSNLSLHITLNADAKNDSVSFKIE